MEVVSTVFTVVLVVLSIVLAVVGVQMVMVLMELKKAIRRVNDVMDAADEKISAIVAPLQKISGLAAGMGTGMKVFESFVGWLQRSRQEADVIDAEE